MKDINIKSEKNVIRKKRIGASIAYDVRSWLFVLPTILILILVTYRPLFMGIWYSLHNMQGYTVKEWCGFKNYIEIFKDKLFLTALTNSIKYVIWSLAIGYFLPVLLAVLLNEAVRGKSIMRFFVYLPTIVPGMAAAMLWYMIYFPGDTGLLNIMLGKMGMPASQWLENPALTIPLIVFSITWGGAGSTTIYYLAALQGVNRELYEAGVIDGMGILNRLKNIAFPQLYPVMLLFLVQQIMGVFQIMEQPLSMTGGGPNNASLSLALLGYRYGFVYYKAGHGIAVGVIQFVMLMFMTLIYFKLEKKANEF